MENNYVLILYEVKFHPKSLLPKLTGSVETTSIVHVNNKTQFRQYNKRPLFDEKYLVLFDDVNTFKKSKESLSFKTMFPVVSVDSKTAVDDLKFICRNADIPYKVCYNEFTREHAYTLISEQATQKVSDAVAKAIIRQVGLNPMRIITAIAVCEQVGYSASNVEKYVDKWTYPDIRKIIECLLGVPPSATAKRNAYLYLHANRHWFKHVRKRISTELEAMLSIYQAKIAGQLADSNMLDYMEENRVPRARIAYTLKMFDKVSIVELLSLNEFIKSASILEVALRLN